MPKENFRLCDRIASGILSVTILLCLFAFIPGGFLSGTVLKGYILVVGISATLLSWIIGRLMEGSVHFPRTWILPVLGAFILALFLSALFSHTPYLSFFGEGLDQGAFVPSLALATGLFLAVMLFSVPKRTSRFFSAAFLVYIVLGLFQLAHLFLPSLTSFGVFTNSVSTPLGSWSDFAYFSGAALIGSVLVLQFWKPAARARALVALGGLLALFFVALTNVFLVWVLVGLSLFGILVYALLLPGHSGDERKPFPFLPFVLTAVTIFFVIANASFGYKLADALHAHYSAANPSMKASFIVLHDSVSNQPVFGAGLNRFTHEWLAYRPLSVNLSPLWDTQFSFGSSYLVTELMLAGILGILAGLAFLYVFLRKSIREVFVPMPEHESSAQATHTAFFGLFLLTLYFLVIIALSAPGISITILSYFFIGLFLAALWREKRMGTRTIALLSNYRVGLASVSVAFLSIALVIVGLLGATRRVSAQTYFQKGILAANAGQLDTADADLVQAIGIVNAPSFERARILLAEQSIQTLVSTVPDGQDLTSDQKTKASAAIQTGNVAGLAAVSLDPSDVQNYLAYGDFMKALMPFKVSSAFANARDAYLQAVKAAPNYPLPYLDLAEIYADSGDTANATMYANQAIAKKANYTDAYFLEEHMSYASGDLSAAQSHLQAALSFDGNNPDIYTEIGFVDYKMGNYPDAVTALRTAVNLGTTNIETWYYLAESLVQTGDTKSALSILTSLHVKFPDNTDVSNALINLTAPAPVVTPTPASTIPAVPLNKTKKPAAAEVTPTVKPKTN